MATSFRMNSITMLVASPDGQNYTGLVRENEDAGELIPGPSPNENLNFNGIVNSGPNNSWQLSNFNAYFNGPNQDATDVQQVNRDNSSLGNRMRQLQQLAITVDSYTPFGALSSTTFDYQNGANANIDSSQAFINTNNNYQNVRYSHFHTVYTYDHRYHPSVGEYYRTYYTDPFGPLSMGNTLTNSTIV
jgi:hypothetical protein